MRDVCANATGCGFTELTFWQYMAACVVVDANGCYRLNSMTVAGDCDDYTSAIKCGMNTEDPLPILKNIFGIDACGRMALKIVNVAETPT